MATRTGESGILLKPTEIFFEIDLLDLHASDPQRYPFLLESVAGEAPLSRYDILFAFPQSSLKLDDRFHLHGSRESTEHGFLGGFDDWWARLREPVDLYSEYPFRGGWFIFLGYELAGEIEPSLKLATHPGLPVALAVRIPVAIVRDRRRSAAWIIGEHGCESLVNEVHHDVRKLQPTSAYGNSVLADGSLNEDPPERFLTAVEAAKEYIAAGDIYQANIARQWSGLLKPDAGSADVYKNLRRSNPAPFAGLAVFDEMSLICSSPERLVRSQAGRVETRPIAGTRPRDPSPGADEPRRTELLGHPKERAEHIMLIDLERNDLGRICTPGSVTVDEFMVVETYSHVHHIVSNIAGRLRDTSTPGSMIRAVFPGGSITGCPKVRCMQIIQEVEGRARGAYTGAMGYINRDGSGDLNILIRTIITAGRDLWLATGSGIVADSDPWQELDETRAKAKGLLMALGHNG